ncbi:MAG: hypothetical protein GY864_01395 [Desulfobacterales bacterium]|nr:hypothetical protein [Desulfobacterales bacterium]
MPTNKITESEIEKFAIELLEKSGYEYIYGPYIAPDLSACDTQAGAQAGAQAGSETPERIL